MQVLFDSSLGGLEARSLDTSVARKPHWASTYTGSAGALFIEFHVDGNPTKVHGYFKTVEGVVIDPPSSSGKTAFSISYSP